MSNDIEAPALGERTPLVASDANAGNETAPRASPSTSSAGSSTLERSVSSESSVDDIKDELDKPWPATFDRGIQILAGPVLDEAKAADFTKSPVVRARYRSKNKLNRGYNTPEPQPPSSLMYSPGTPAWLKKGLVRMKSLDYTFSDQNTAIPTPKINRNRQQQKLDAHAYRQKILIGKAGGSSSSGHLAIDKHDVTASPGFRREKQMDKQRKKEKELELQSSEEEDHKSSFAQCTFNMANILMGVGMLGLPYVFKSAGWIGGFCVTTFFCFVTWRTSYYLGRELNGDPRPVHLFDAVPPDNTIVRMRKPISSFPAIAREAFGDSGCICLSAILYFELFSCLSIFFVSLGDHLHALYPSVSQSKHMTIVAGILTLPSALLRTPKLLSYLSAVGTFATVAVVLSVVLSALLVLFTIGDAGSEREYKLYSSSGLPLAAGIVAYCFSGHAIVPSIYQSMKRPQEFERMIDLTYGVVLLSCLLVAVSGYYMFGDNVEDQITLSLENESENAGVLMSALTWLMILTAISKFTLTMFPLALGFEEMLTGILPNDLAMELVDSVVKIMLIFSSLAVAIFFPSFSFLCSLVGLICTIVVSVIFPALAHLKLFGTNLSALEKLIDWLLVAGGSVIAVIGTIATLKEDI
mmetsp:Transcript_13666/g.29621  ORF Transcript_13666/g.29621 Transcript_13666/m.29621 type:complete len:638 (+) Transcript_13666:116-2029(+)|eukprot:CAMPEP_0172544826 /NCGR_PEP_ID=MMETSP1067-20121228/14886_1 /TAXON_ID=265564 ORGANISM="Thalassiosira punctigera, Strain Tpunct2005C2" /NCGR_SAMPLE_ID=MMETSP1067 /ASSEMBLY_ACC=CAM_ASM_000444 /LENGTH=637 /DNA_ID=CAMNT_0013331451 /DNA_START=116 /DNA_END=2029 /DNA_ORIENTATION=-